MIRPLLRLAIAGLVAASGLAAQADSASPMPSASPPSSDSQPLTARTGSDKDGENRGAAAEPDAQAARDAAKALVGTWRIVSYPTSEGDLLRRHGREPGPLPDRQAPLEGWSHLVFDAEGRCALFYPQKIKDRPPHRRITWFHDEDNFDTWRLDATTSPWRLDLGSVAVPQWRTVRGTDPASGKAVSRREAVVDPQTGGVVVRQWTYPAACRIDGPLLTLVWWQNHRLLERPGEEHRPSVPAGLPESAVRALNEKRPFVRDDPRCRVPGGISVFVAQKVSDEPLQIPAPPPPSEVLRTSQTIPRRDRLPGIAQVGADDRHGAAFVPSSSASTTGHFFGGPLP